MTESSNKLFLTCFIFSKAVVKTEYFTENIQFFFRVLTEEGSSQREILSKNKCSAPVRVF